MDKKAEYGMPSRRRPLQAGEIVTRMALLLLCLVMVSAYFTGGLLARYSSTAQSSDTARVAKFDVQLTGDPSAAQITCGQNEDQGTYFLTVENASEVAVQYSISYTITPNGFDNTANAVTCTLDQENGVLAPGATSGRHSFTLTVADWSALTKNMSGNTGAVSVNIIVTVDIAQVD